MVYIPCLTVLLGKRNIISLFPLLNTLQWSTLIVANRNHCFPDSFLGYVFHIITTVSPPEKREWLRSTICGIFSPGKSRLLAPSAGQGQEGMGYLHLSRKGLHWLHHHGPRYGTNQSYYSGQLPAVWCVNANEVRKTGRGPVSWPWTNPQHFMQNLLLGTWLQVESELPWVYGRNRSKASAPSMSFVLSVRVLTNYMYALLYVIEF